MVAAVGSDERLLRNDAASGNDSLTGDSKHCFAPHKSFDRRPQAHALCNGYRHGAAGPPMLFERELKVAFSHSPVPEESRNGA
jgi:hypothetical protein